MIWFGWVLWHINHCRLFNAKSSVYIYIKYIWFGLVGFYGISTIVGYLMPNPLYTYISNIYDLVGLAFMAYQPLEVNAKSSLCIYIKYVLFGLVGFYGISTIVGYLMPNPLHTYIKYMIWFGWVLWHIKNFRLFNTESSLYIYIYIYRIWFSSVLWHINLVGYLMPNSVYTYILNIYDLVWLAFIAYQPL